MTRMNGLHLVLFTSSFPYGVGEPFLEAEILYLAREFRTIVLVPLKIRDDARTLPENVVVDTSLARSMANRPIRLFMSVFVCLRSLAFYREALAHPKRVVNFSGLRRLIRLRYQAHRVAYWLIRYCESNRVDFSNTFFYTYWLIPQTIGIGLIKPRYPDMRVVSRAHGSDIYEEAGPPFFHPFRRLTFAAIDHVFVNSEDGKRYILERYARYRPRVELARLGVKQAPHDTPTSSDGAFRVVSCSFIVPVKRLHLIIEGLRTLAQQHPDWLILWNHIGDGDSRLAIESLAHEQLPENVRWSITGNLANEDVLHYYKSNPVDVFINLSRSEGIPVSIMEAQSYGIPVIATAVGGVPEIVNAENGILLNPNPSPEHVADALAIMADPEQQKPRRIASQHTWQSLYDGEQNYRRFALRLASLCG